ncbi:hypothetical protein [Psychroserpens algicola]|uniref:DUF3592 domain-containing protein n=1 Tax=Psychroserpens algicola TaxID=1719034 RepID=A0ABT0H762_9FLAO|nr:hypothetical protein [Psychroserpens algicola]MCK8479665.1 hypothetical protein [Psychroserpens algicola]
MNIPLRDKIHFTRVSLKKNAGPLLIGLIFIILGLVLAYIGYFIAENNFLTGFGITFISFSGFFLIYTMPSSYMHYYEQELTKKYGSYTTARVVHKRIDDYSHTSSSFEGGKAIQHEEYLYVIEFEFNYKNKSYESECFFEQKKTYEQIPVGYELPVKFLRNNPEKVTLRRRKLANELGISEKMCQ